MANNKYYYRAVVWFGDNGGYWGEKHTKIKDCEEDLIKFINLYLRNDVVFIGIKKYNAATNEEFICPQSLNSPMKY